jgi:integrase
MRSIGLQRCPIPRRVFIDARTRPDGRASPEVLVADDFRPFCIARPGRTRRRAIRLDHAPARAIDLAIGERTNGPLFRAADGRRLDRHGAARIVRRVTRRGGIAKHVSPHTLRHAFITVSFDAGVPLRDVKRPLLTPIRASPGRARTSLDRHATYIVAAFIAGAAR